MCLLRGTRWIFDYNSARKLEFNPGSVHVISVEDKVEGGGCFFPSTAASPRQYLSINERYSSLTWHRRESGIILENLRGRKCSIEIRAALDRNVLRFNFWKVKHCGNKTILYFPHRQPDTNLQFYFRHVVQRNANGESMVSVRQPENLSTSATTWQA